MRQFVFLSVIISLILLIGCQEKNTPPYAPSTPVGESLGFINTSYGFMSHAVDYDADRVAIRFDWDDGDTSNWGVFYASDSTIIKQHAWSDAGIYHIRSQARDEHDELSGWSNIHHIMISNFRK